MPDRHRPDACPGALDVHQAADGGLARVRVPGGTLTRAQLTALHTAMALGDGTLELTSRANTQIRGLAPGAEHELAAVVAQAGLLPSTSHERMRNLIASPLADTQGIVDRIDAALLARPGLAGLPGRFLVTVDDGGDVSGLRADVGVHRVGPEWALLLAGQDSGLRFTDPVTAVVGASEAFAALREEGGGTAWRLAEIEGGVAEITRRLDGGPAAAGPVSPLPPTPLPPGPLPDGRVVVGAPLGRLTSAQVEALLSLPWVRLTPWRSLVLPAPVAVPGLVTDPGSPWHGATACTGKPGCAKSLADVRADAARLLRAPGGPVHLSGCARRCGRPPAAVDVLATATGYLVDDLPYDDPVLAISAARRKKQR